MEQFDQISKDRSGSSDLIFSPANKYSENPPSSLLRDLCPEPYSNNAQILSVEFAQNGDTWELRYRQYLLLVQKYGDAHPPSDPEYEGLKDWLNRQILNRRHLSASQFQRLDRLGIIWDQAFSRDHAWDIMFTRLKEFNATFGHSRVPHGWNKDRPLALWVTRQRKMYLTDKIQEYRKCRLNELAFVWQARALYKVQWESYYLQLASFQAKHGHCNVPGKEAKLVSWIERQRLSKKKKTLSPERENMLNAINFVWEFQEIKRQVWAQKYRQLAAFKKKYGHSFVPVNYKRNKALGLWVAVQRKLEANNKLPKARVIKLEELDFVWSSETRNKLRMEYDSLWEKSFEKLKVYKELHGTCQVSLNADPALQSWTVCQRKLYYEGKMTSYRVGRLNEISFPWSISEDYWLKMYGTLTDYYIRFGHTRIPSHWPENPRLAAWVYRTRLNKNRLGLEKIDLLDRLGFEWGLARKTREDWSSMYNRLLVFKRRHGHTRVPARWSADLKLGKWVSRMRYERIVMGPERRARLEAIEFDWGNISRSDE